MPFEGLLKEASASRVKFEDQEVDFLEENQLGRIATVSPEDMQPHVVPVSFEFDGQYFYFGGWNLKNSLKFRNLKQNNKVSFVVDDLLSTKPWHPRGIEIRGTAEIIDNKEDGTYVRIVPLRKASWGIVASLQGKRSV